MASVFRLEEFALPDPAGAAPDPFAGLVPEAEREAARLEGYDRGYRSGWDDAVAATVEDRSRIGAEFARNLQDLGFTYHEARAHVMRGVEPLLEEILATFLPRSMQGVLARTLLDELETLAAASADAPIRLLVSPADAPTLRFMLDASVSVPFQVVEEAALAEGQVYLALGGVERNIDLPAALERLGTALRAASDLNGRTLKHG